MSESFENRNLADATFRGISLQRVRFEDVNLQGAVIRNANLQDLAIEDANITGLTVFGWKVEQLISAELDRRDPERARLRFSNPADPSSVRSTFGRLDELRTSFVGTMRAASPAAVGERPQPNEWSALEHVRHLLFADALYFRIQILGSNEALPPLGLLPSHLADNPFFATVGIASNPRIESVLGAWVANFRQIMTFVDELTPSVLARDTRSNGGPGTVADVLQNLPLHNLEHIRQALLSIRQCSENIQSPESGDA